MTRRALVLAVLLAATPAWADGPARLVGTLQWHAQAKGFGGLSGLDVSHDGSRFTAIGDRGLRIEGQIERRAGNITGVSGLSALALADDAGAPLGEDSEGLAVSRDGTLYVSFEGAPSRIGRYATHRRITWVPGHEAFGDFGANSGLEALALDPEGRLVAIPERSDGPSQPFPVWRRDNGTWARIAQLPRRGRFLVTGADFGPDGRLYILERSFSPLGFRTRVRRFQLGPRGAGGEEMLLTSGLGEHDNLEGLSVWKAPDGTLRLTMVSDDNFSLLQRTEFVEYALPGD